LNSNIVLLKGPFEFIEVASRYGKSKVLLRPRPFVFLQDDHSRFSVHPQKEPTAVGILKAVLKAEHLLVKVGGARQVFNPNRYLEYPFNLHKILPLVWWRTLALTDARRFCARPC